MSDSNPAGKCPECGGDLRVGDWPFCQGSADAHRPIRELNARRWEPIVVWEADAEPGKFSYPGQSDEPVPEGYHRVELLNLREADLFVKRVNGIERGKAELDRRLNYQAIDEAVQRRRRDTEARIRGNPRAEALYRAARDWADKRRELIRARHRMEPNFHIQVLSFDSGNRNSYSGPETGWRERKK